MTVLIKRDEVVRQATDNDLPRLFELEALCRQHGRITKQQIRMRLKTYPHGQFVFEKGDKIVGAIYSVRAAASDAVVGCQVGNVHHVHDAAGPIVLMLDMHVEPGLLNEKKKGAFLTSVLQLCRTAAGVREVQGIVDCTEFDATGALTFDDYLSQGGVGRDAELAFHGKHGATVVRSLPNYRARNSRNHGNAVLVTYAGESKPAVEENHLFVLSALTQERLEAYASKVARWLDTASADISFDDAIYTWQVARMAMKCRLAIRVSNRTDLQEKLGKWLLDPAGGAADTWQGAVMLRDGVVHAWQGEEGQQRLEQAVVNQDWQQIAAMWTAGAEMDWKRLHAASGKQCRRVSVPTYPFARERHWLEGLAFDAPESTTAAAKEKSEHIFVTSAWEQAPDTDIQHDVKGAHVFGRHDILLCEVAGIGADQLSALIASSHCAMLEQPAQGDIGARYTGYAEACFEKIKEIFSERLHAPTLLQLVLPDAPEPMLLTGLVGLLKTAAKENANFVGQIIVSDAIVPGDLAEQLRRESIRLNDALILYRQGARHVVRWQPVPEEQVEGQASGFRDKGVYLITGGLGGLGVLFAGEILRQAAQTSIILTGRTALSGTRQVQFDALMRDAAKQGGGMVAYRQLDLEDRDQVATLVGDILQEHGQLNGIFHCAGMLADNLILNKATEEFRRVLAPKVTGTLNLDTASRDVDLDFFALFSSATSVFGNSGQCDYAAANGFMDQFAAYRNRLREHGERKGLTLSINWPLWQDGGMSMSPAVLEALHRRTGLRPMRASTGLQVFSKSLASQCGQTMVLEGDKDKIIAMLASASLAVRGQTRPAVSAEQLRDAVQHKLRQLFADVTKRSAAKIDMHEALATYGIDSIIIGNLNLGLAKVFGEISKTLFFEFQTLADLGGYLTSTHLAECVAWCSMEEHAAQGHEECLEPVRQEPDQPGAGQSSIGRTMLQHGTPEPIAIVGISGVYPQAADIDTFWENLREGKNCIVEIPHDRWALDDFYQPDVDAAVEQGKSYSKWGGFIEQFADFDPLFFNISPREAMNIDPHERLFLQECWRALENAGYTRHDLKNRFRQRVGVFAGITKPGYNLYAMHPTLADEPFFPYTSFSSAANRLSYFLDITGPSMPIDTMCSSSLVAIHEACEHIRRGECDLAFAGGVNLYLHSYTYSWLCSHQMLARDGLCRSFGAGGNGFVPGEGVGAVLLKSLSDAQRDGDPIHGVILASHINHGGKTNGYTVPNPRAQAELIRHTIDKAGIKASDISYIEAHGTGTELGDPIEISGLQQAFAPDSKENGYCRIGSAKSNIGHLEAAAGIASLTKVLLQMKHRQLAPSLHADELNPNIAFDKTAFRVNTRLSPWQPPQSASGQSGTRIAGISSFGASGVNAHIIVQEYQEPVRTIRSGGEPVIIPLSARSTQQLEQRVADLLQFMRRTTESVDLEALACTLQLGREAMEERLCLLVNSTDELKSRLAAWLDGKQDNEGIYRGQVTRNKEALQLFCGDEDFQETLDKWIARRKLPRLAELWARGMNLEWDKLYGPNRPPRIALPGYPFAKERFWVDTVVEMAHAQAKASQPAILHPLLHANTSNLSRQRYTSVFTGDEFFLRDHQVRNEKILPAVAYLEMARSAVELALSSPLDGCQLELRNIAWMQPIVVSGATEVSISLYVGEDADQIEFEVSTATAEPDGEVLHNQGEAVILRDAAPGRLDIEQLKAGMAKGMADVAAIYQDYAAMGVVFGPGHRAIQAVFLGEQQILAQLRLPGAIESTGGTFFLHPSMMDCALQASICLMNASIRGSRQPFLPFSLDTLRVVAPCSKEMFAWIRSSPTVHAADRAIKLDVDLCDQSGNICVQMRGFVSRALEKEQQPDAHYFQAESHSPGRPKLHSLVPVWQRLSPVAEDAALHAPGRLLLVGGGNGALEWVRQSCPDVSWLELTADVGIDDIRGKLATESFDHLLWMAPDVTNDSAPADAAQMIEVQDHGVLAVFRLAKALLDLDYAHRDLQWTLITRNTQRVHENDLVSPAHAGIIGFVGSLAKEYPGWDMRLLDIDSAATVTASECLSITADKDGNGLAYRCNEWFRQGLARLAELPNVSPAWRQGGVYVVIGGAGGIGEAWSRYMIERFDARLVWIGRRPMDKDIKAKIQALGNLGHAPDYFAVDAADRTALQAVHQQILAIHPAIHGVVHSAIDLQDQSIALMEESAFRASLSAKVDVSVNLYEVFGQHDLDCMLFFSSMISFSKGAGQSNYAAGCTFKDSFAHSLAQYCSYPVKIMNWGYWGNVGVVTDAFYNQRMLQMGIGSIEAPEAMEVLETLVSSSLGQMAVLKTMDDRVMDEIALPENAIIYPVRIASALVGAIRNFDEIFARKSLAELQKDLPGDEVHVLCTDILASTLTSLGLFDPQSADQAGGLSHPLHARWLHASLSYLHRQGRPVRALDNAWADWEAKKISWIANPNLRAQIALLEACLKSLAEILTGRRPATDVMFPNSSMQLVEGVYKDHTLADYCNDVLGATLCACIRQRLQANPHCGIRILEIGAGTGGTTARLLPMLQEFGAAITEYCYTDLSRAFLLHAEEKYRPQLPALTTAIFDASKPLQPQSIAMDRFDFVLATNVLHATSDIRETLRNTKALLHKQGVLLLNEMSTWSLFSHLTFGLLDGWWLYEDAALRLPGSPGLSPEKWRRALEEEGYETVSFMAPEAHELGQQIIAAQSNGQVLQRMVKAAQESGAAQVATEPVNAVPAPKIAVPALVAAREDEVPESLRDRCIAYLQEVVGKTLKMAPSQVGSHRPLSEYGLDSILVVGLTNQLRKVIPGISSTLFFEVQHVAGLADYLLETKQEHVVALLGTTAAPEASQQACAAPTARAALAVATMQAQIVPRFRRRGGQQDMTPTSVAPAASTLFDVAVVGVSGRYPQSPNLDEFWHNLSRGSNCVTEIPADRWDWKAFYDPEKGKLGKTYSKWGGFIQDIDKFDPLFFRISPKEAKLMDPQERLFLESCYHAIEDAGYTPETLADADRIGVFAGVMNSRYTSQPHFYSLANRVSFVLNFRGPSMAVDTACSSSLTAIHLALESLYSGLSECALAGGVNLIFDPVHYLELSSVTMLSSGNQCKSFGDGADGFVDAEGVGVVVLKPLKKAEQDGDHIYGVIKASAINAGGRTNGYTVPNPVAQAAVVKKAMERAGVSAADISYIEAHGTGTSLGDPIEIAGLKRAFEEYSKEKQFCAIGSIKSNIGHCESAAGIAALTKVLLQFEHQKLLPSLHADVLNHEIDFSQTPFRFQKHLEEWVRPSREIRGVIREIPRIAGISSFGAGGANAHLIVQEYAPAAPAAMQQPGSAAIIPLSARTAEQLEQKVHDLLNYVRTRQRTRELPDLQAVAYTLQVGREAMEERLALVASSISDLADKLEACLHGSDAVAGVYRGRVKRHQMPAASEVHKGEQQGGEIDLQSLAHAWTKGASSRWDDLYAGRKPIRISLPVYPFAKERYWSERTDYLPAVSRPVIAAALHPLLHRNVSTIRQQCYRSRFTGNEPLVAGHQLTIGVAEQKIMPAMVFLEMARAAVEDAIAPLAGSAARRTLELFNVAWSDAAVIDRAMQLSVALFDEGDNQLAYEIFSTTEDGAEDIILCQGQALLGNELAPAKLDLAQLASQMRRGTGHYRAMSLNSMQYGSAYQGVASVATGDGQLLAELVLPGVIADDAGVENERLVLHPVMMDSALQAASNLLTQENQSSLPLAMASLRILKPCTSDMFAWVRHSADQGGSDKLQLDLDLCDRHGNVCVEIRGLAYERELQCQPGLLREAISSSAATPALALEAHARPKPAVHLAALVSDKASVVLSEPGTQAFAAGVLARPQISLSNGSWNGSGREGE